MLRFNGSGSLLPVRARASERLYCIQARGFKHGSLAEERESAVLIQSHKRVNKQVAILKL